MPYMPPPMPFMPPPMPPMPPHAAAHATHADSSAAHATHAPAHAAHAPAHAARGCYVATADEVLRGLTGIHIGANEVVARGRHLAPNTGGSGISGIIGARFVLVLVVALVPNWVVDARRLNCRCRTC